MATESMIWDESFIAAEDLSSSQFYIVSSSAEGYVAKCAASSGAIGIVKRPFGILQNTPTSGHAATVRLWGKSKVVASSSAASAVTYGTYMGCSAAGTAITATTGMLVLGTIMKASSTAATSGVLSEVMLLSPFHYQAAAGTS